MNLDHTQPKNNFGSARTVADNSTPTWVSPTLKMLYDFTSHSTPFLNASSMNGL